MKSVRLVMVEPTHSGNVGAAARAMKNMGLSDLVLVSPSCDHLSGESIARAAGAEDILKQAARVSTLSEALAGIALVYGTSARLRRLDRECVDPRQCASKIIATTSSVAVVFGRESSGLTNQELLKCHYHIHIPSVESFSSLNLAQAVQVIAYELRMASLSSNNTSVARCAKESIATHERVEGFYNHLETTLQEMMFIPSKEPVTFVSRIRLMFNRIQLQDTEVNILRGFLAAIKKERLYLKQRKWDED